MIFVRDASLIGGWELCEGMWLAEQWSEYVYYLVSVPGCEASHDVYKFTDIYRVRFPEARR